MKKKFEDLTDLERKTIKDDLHHAYDFDPRDPLFGLTRDKLSGPGMNRRTVMRLMPPLCIAHCSDDGCRRWPS